MPFRGGGVRAVDIMASFNIVRTYTVCLETTRTGRPLKLSSFRGGLLGGVAELTRKWTESHKHAAFFATGFIMNELELALRHHVPKDFEDRNKGTKSPSVASVLLSWEKKGCSCKDVNDLMRLVETEQGRTLRNIWRTNAKAVSC